MLSLKEKNGREEKGAEGEGEGEEGLGEGVEGACGRRGGCGWVSKRGRGLGDKRKGKQARILTMTSFGRNKMRSGRGSVVAAADMGVGEWVGVCEVVGR